MNPNTSTVDVAAAESVHARAALPSSPVRVSVSCGFVAGAGAGALVGLGDALLGGASGIVFTYASAVGLVAGGALGGFFGFLRGAAARPPRATEEDAGGATVLAVAALLLVAVLPDVSRLFATAFRNRELAALTLAVVSLLAFVAAVVVGAAVRGVLERAASRGARLRAVRVVRGATVALWMLAAGAAVLQVARARVAIEPVDGRAAGLLLVGLAGALACFAWLRSRGFRLAALPYLVRRGALVLSLAATYAAYQMLTGSAPTSVKNARSALVLSALALPEQEVDVTAVTASGAPSSGAARGPGDTTASPRAAAGITTAAPAPEAAAVPPPAAPRPSILFVTLSSTRADHTSLYGYARPTTPKLDAFAKRCTVFERAYAGASSERDAMQSLLSGRLVSQLRRSVGAWPRLRPGQRLLAEALAGTGYHAAAVVSHDVLRKESGLAAGFASYDASLARVGERATLTGESAPAVAAKAMALLGGLPADKPFFLWAHFADAHARHVPHPGIDFGKRPADRYDGEVAFVDEQLGTLLAAAQASARKPWIVIVGDHGESLGEHGRRGHGRSVSEAELRVPLVVCGEGVRAQRVEPPVSVLDLFPTLATLAGASLPTGLPGQSLVPVLRGDARPDDRRPIGFENSSPSPVRLGAGGLIVGHEKLVSVGAGNFPRLFDLRADPGERRNLARQRPERVRKLQIALGQIRAPSLQGAPPPTPGRRRVISAAEDAAEQEALKRTHERKQRMWGNP